MRKGTAVRTGDGVVGDQREIAQGDAGLEPEKKEERPIDWHGPKETDARYGCED